MNASSTKKRKKSRKKKQDKELDAHKANRVVSLVNFARLWKSSTRAPRELNGVRYFLNVVIGFRNDAKLMRQIFEITENMAWKRLAKENYLATDVIARQTIWSFKTLSLEHHQYLINCIRRPDFEYIPMMFRIWWLFVQLVSFWNELTKNITGYSLPTTICVNIKKEYVKLSKRNNKPILVYLFNVFCEKALFAKNDIDFELIDCKKHLEESHSAFMDLLNIIDIYTYDCYKNQRQQVKNHCQNTQKCLINLFGSFPEYFYNLQEIVKRLEEEELTQFIELEEYDSGTESDTVYPDFPAPNDDVGDEVEEKMAQQQWQKLTHFEKKLNMVLLDEFGQSDKALPQTIEEMERFEVRMGAMDRFNAKAEDYESIEPPHKRIRLENHKKWLQRSKRMPTAEELKEEKDRRDAEEECEKLNSNLLGYMPLEQWMNLNKVWRDGCKHVTTVKLRRKIFVLMFGLIPRKRSLRYLTKRDLQHKAQKKRELLRRESKLVHKGDLAKLVKEFKQRNKENKNKKQQQHNNKKQQQQHKKKNKKKKKPMEYYVNGWKLQAKVMRQQQINPFSRVMPAEEPNFDYDASVITACQRWLMDEIFCNSNGVRQNDHYLDDIFENLKRIHASEEDANFHLLTSITYFVRMVKTRKSILFNLQREIFVLADLVLFIANRQLHERNYDIYLENCTIHSYKQRVIDCVPPQTPKCHRTCPLPLKFTQSTKTTKTKTIITPLPRCELCNEVAKSEWFNAMKCENDHYIHMFCLPLECFKYIEPEYLTDPHHRAYIYKNQTVLFCPICSAKGIVQYSAYAKNEWTFVSDVFHQKTQKVTSHLLRLNAELQANYYCILPFKGKNDSMLSLQHKVDRAVSYIIPKSNLNHDQWEWKRGRHILKAPHKWGESVQSFQILKDFLKTECKDQINAISSNKYYSDDANDFFLATNNPIFEGNGLKCGGISTKGYFSQSEYELLGLGYATKCFDKFKFFNRTAWSLYVAEETLRHIFDYTENRIKEWYGLAAYGNLVLGVHRLMFDCGGKDPEFWSAKNFGLTSDSEWIQRINAERQAHKPKPKSKLKPSDYFDKLTHKPPVLMEGIGSIRDPRNPKVINLIWDCIRLRMECVEGTEWMEKYMPNQHQVNGYLKSGGIRAHTDHLSWFLYIILFKLFSNSSLHFGVKNRMVCVINHTYLFPLMEGERFDMTKWMNTHFLHQLPTWCHWKSGITALFRLIRPDALIYKNKKFIHPCAREMTEKMYNLILNDEAELLDSKEND